jgi:hypothetical protein
MTATTAQLAYDSILQALHTHGKPIDRGINNASSECPNHAGRATLTVRIHNDTQVILNCHQRCTPKQVMTALGLNGDRASNNKGQQADGSRPLPADVQQSLINMQVDDEYRKMKARELAKQRLIQESEAALEWEEDPNEHDAWEPVDLTKILAGNWKPPQPTIGRRSDGKYMLYPAKCHTVVGETESAKTWFALSAAIDEIHDRHHVLYFDFEDDEGTVTGRLMTLGLSRQLISSHFHYFNPDMPLNTKRSHDRLRQVIGDTNPTLAIIDGITEAMTVHDLNPLDNVDAAKFGRILPKKLTAAGLACVSLDHVTKDSGNRGRYAIGAVHKLNALDGAGYILENRQPFGIGMRGVTTIKIAKDRMGQLRRNALPAKDSRYWFGDMVMDSKGDEFAELTIYPPIQKDGDERPVKEMGLILDCIRERNDKGVSQRMLMDLIPGASATKRRALAILIDEGQVTDSTPHKLAQAT